MKVVCCKNTNRNIERLMCCRKNYEIQGLMLSECTSLECEFSLKKDSDETLDFVFHISPVQTQSVHTFFCSNSHFILMKAPNSKHQLSIIFWQFTTFLYYQLPSVFTGITLGCGLNPHSVQSRIAFFKYMY